MSIKIKLYGIVNRLMKSMPNFIQEWWRLRKVVSINRSKIHNGEFLVPVEALKNKQRKFLHKLLEIESAESLGDYMEFGVYNGTSLSCMHHILEEFNNDKIRLFGFDSWQGLPDSAAHDDEAAWEPGQFHLDYNFAKKYLKEQGVNFDRTYLIKGWFKDTLNDELITRYDIKKLSIAMVDCDMYLSAKESLDFCAPLIHNHAILIFDDWRSNKLNEKNLGEKKAFEEFLMENSRFKYEDLGGYNENSKAFYIYDV